MTDLIDHRQRLAACILLSAIDLPAEMGATAKAWAAASRVCPRATVAEVRLGNRREGLERAAELIQEMIAELPPADG